MEWCIMETPFDEEPDDFEFYGYDPDGPTSIHNDNVVVNDIDLGGKEVITSFVLERLDPSRESNALWIDIFHEALELQPGPS